MGTQYQVINKTRKEIYGFGLNWNPKYQEAIMNIDPRRFLLFLMLYKYRGDHIIIINDGNAFDWNYEINLKDYRYKDEEIQKEYLEWCKEERIVDAI